MEDKGVLFMGTGPSPSDRPQTTPGIVVPLAFFASIGLTTLVLFCCVRKFFKDIYLPRLYLTPAHKIPPYLSKGFLSWVPKLLAVKESDIISTLGLDAVTFLRFLWMGFRLFGLLSLLGMGFLAPVNFYAEEPSFANSTGFLYEDVLLPSLSVNNVPNRSPYLWVHLLFTWVFSLCAIGFLVSFYRETLSSKLKYETRILKETLLNRIDGRSIMVFGIPRDLRREIELAAYFDSLGIGRVENVVICRKWSKLKAAVQMRAKVLNDFENLFIESSKKLERIRKKTPYGSPLGGETGSSMPSESFPSGLESGENDFDGLYRSLSGDECEKTLTDLVTRIPPIAREYRRKGLLGCTGPKVDVLEYTLEQFKLWNREVDLLRRTPEDSPPTGVGFITFSSPLSAAIASQVVIHRRPFACMARMAPEPRDLYWPNLSSGGADSSIKLFRSLVVMGSLLFLVFSSTAIVTTFAGLIDLRQLALYIPGLKDLLHELPEAWIQLIQGVIPTILVAAWTSSLPAVLLVLSRMQGLETESWIENSVLAKYFFYQLWNILFVQVLVRAVLYELVLNPRQFIEVLGEMVPKASPTLINYVMLQATSVYPAQLLLVGPLVLTWLTRLSPWSESTPRQKSDAYYPSILTCINYGIAYPIPMLMFVVGVTYAPIAPLMLPFCCLFFVIAYLVYKYLFLYVHVPRYENKAQSIPLVVNRCLAGLVIMQLTMMGLLALKSIGPEENGRHRMVLSKQPGWSGYAQMVAGIAPLLMLTGMVYWWLRQGYEKEIIQVPIEVISKAMRGVSIQPGAAFNSPDTHDSFAFDGQELEPFSGVGDVSHESHPPSMKADASIESPNDVPGFTSENDVNGAVSDPETLGLRVDTDMDGDVNEETSLLGDAFHSALQSSHPEMLDDNVLAYHLEPPMTRVQGILDAPVTFDPLSQDADLQNASYLHPALIGRLPVPWLSSKEEVGPPESSSSLGVLERLRSEQSRRQRQSLKRFLGRQRLGVRAMEEEQVGDGDAADRSLSGQTSFPCLDRQLHMQRPFRRVRNFMDGLTAWAHLTLS